MRNSDLMVLHPSPDQVRGKANYPSGKKSRQ